MKEFIFKFLERENKMSKEWESFSEVGIDVPSTESAAMISSQVSTGKIMPTPKILIVKIFVVFIILCNISYIDNKQIWYHFRPKLVKMACGRFSKIRHYLFYLQPITSILKILENYSSLSFSITKTQ